MNPIYYRMSICLINAVKRTILLTCITLIGKLPKGYRKLLLIDFPKSDSKSS